MRLLIALFLLIIFGQNAFAQNSEIQLRINQLSFFNDDERVFAEDSTLLITSNYLHNVNSNDFDIGYLWSYKKIELVARVGWRGLSIKNERQWTRDTTYNLNENFVSSNTWKAYFGIYQPIALIPEKLTFRFGLLSQFNFLLPWKSESQSLQYSQNDVLISGGQAEFEYPFAWEAGLSANAGIHYKLFKKIWVGIENTNQIKLFLRKGNSYERRIFFDENLENVAEVRTIREEDEFRISKLFGFAIVLAYKF